MKSQPIIVARISSGLKTPAPTGEGLLTRKDVASLLSVHPETVKRMGRRGELSEVIIRRNLIRYRVDQVNALMQNPS